MYPSAPISSGSPSPELERLIAERSRVLEQLGIFRERDRDIVTTLREQLRSGAPGFSAADLREQHRLLQRQIRELEGRLLVIDQEVGQARLASRVPRAEALTSEAWEQMHRYRLALEALHAQVLRTFEQLREVEAQKQRTQLARTEAEAAWEATGASRHQIRDRVGIAEDPTDEILEPPARRRVDLILRHLRAARADFAPWFEEDESKRPWGTDAQRDRLGSNQAPG